jgi:hypothetical protein
MKIRTGPITRNMEFGSRRLRPFGLMLNPSNSLIPNIAPMKIVSFELAIRQEADYF